MSKLGGIMGKMKGKGGGKGESDPDKGSGGTWYAKDR